MDNVVNESEQKLGLDDLYPCEVKTGITNAHSFELREYYWRQGPRIWKHVVGICPVCESEFDMTCSNTEFNEHLIKHRFNRGE